MLLSLKPSKMATAPKIWFSHVFVSNLRKKMSHVCYFVFSHLKSNSIIPIMSLFIRFEIRHYLGRPFSSFIYSYHLWYMSTYYMCLSSHRKSIYGTRTAMLRKTCRLRLSQKIMKFYVLTRFRETIPMV